MVVHVLPRGPRFSVTLIRRYLILTVSSDVRAEFLPWCLTQLQHSPVTVTK